MASAVGPIAAGVLQLAPSALSAACAPLVPPQSSANRAEFARDRDRHQPGARGEGGRDDLRAERARGPGARGELELPLPGDHEAGAVGGGAEGVVADVAVDGEHRAPGPADPRADVEVGEVEVSLGPRREEGAVGRGDELHAPDPARARSGELDGAVAPADLASPEPAAGGVERVARASAARGDEVAQGRAQRADLRLRRVAARDRVGLGERCCCRGRRARTPSRSRRWPRAGSCRGRSSSGTPSRRRRARRARSNLRCRPGRRSLRAPRAACSCSRPRASAARPSSPQLRRAVTIPLVVFGSAAAIRSPPGGDEREARVAGRGGEHRHGRAPHRRGGRGRDGVRRRARWSSRCSTPRARRSRSRRPRGGAG